MNKARIEIINTRKEPKVNPAATELGKTNLPILTFFRKPIIGDPIKEMTQAMIT
jgi:hypothetical protein